MASKISSDITIRQRQDPELICQSGSTRAKRPVPEGSSRHRQQCRTGRSASLFYRWRKWFALHQHQPCAGSARRSHRQYKSRFSIRLTDIAFVLHHFCSCHWDENRRTPHRSPCKVLASAMFSLLPMPRPTLTTMGFVDRRCWCAASPGRIATAGACRLHGVRFASA